MKIKDVAEKQEFYGKIIFALKKLRFTIKENASVKRERFVI